MHVSNWQVTLIIPKKPVCPRALHCASDTRVHNVFLKKKRVRSRAIHCASDIRVHNVFLKKKRVRSRAIHCASDTRVQCTCLLGYTTIQCVFSLSQALNECSIIKCKRRNELRDYERVFCLCDAIIQKWYYIARHGDLALQIGLIGYYLLQRVMSTQSQR